jgi:hypothetical protein
VSRAARRPVAAALAAAATASLATSLDVPVARAHEGVTTWPYTTLVQRIAGASVRLPDRPIKLDRDLVICNGEGRPVRRAGAPQWKHFTCTQSLVKGPRVGKDATFRVHVLTRRRFLITDARYGPD